MRVRSDDGAEPILARLVAAIGVRMVHLYEPLIGLLDLVGLGAAGKAQRLERATIVLVQRLHTLGLRSTRLGPGIAGEDVERILEALGGIAGLAAGAHADDRHLDLAEEALSHLGGVVRVPESALDAITAVSGSGPAYFALLAEAMIEAGILLGLSREISTQLVVQTMLGTAKQLRDEKMHPVELREMVTSPGGTTIAAIRELELAGVRGAFLNAIQAAMVRARELAAGDS